MIEYRCHRTLSYARQGEIIRWYYGINHTKLKFCDALVNACVQVSYRQRPDAIPIIQFSASSSGVGFDRVVWYESMKRWRYLMYDMTSTPPILMSWRNVDEEWLGHLPKVRDLAIADAMRRLASGLSEEGLW